jgi:predicted acyl esterase
MRGSRPLFLSRSDEHPRCQVRGRGGQPVAGRSTAGFVTPLEVRTGVRFEKNVPIPADDGATLMANVFRPKVEGRYLVLVGR